MIEGTNLFTDNKGGRDKSAITHMVRMISLLGPPPQEMLDQSHISKDYFDKHGRHFSLVLPQFLRFGALAYCSRTGSLRKGYKIVKTSLEAEATALEGDEKNGFWDSSGIVSNGKRVNAHLPGSYSMTLGSP